MIYTHAIAALAAAVIAAWGAWSVQGWRLGERITQMEKAQVEATNTAVREARATESRRYQEIAHAQAVAQTRAVAARRDADAARGELDRLRDASRATRGGVPGEPAGACVARADAAGDVLAQCAAAYQELARAADGHANDALMLQQAWPK